MSRYWRDSPQCTFLYMENYFCMAVPFNSTHFPTLLSKFTCQRLCERKPRSRNHWPHLTEQQGIYSTIDMKRCVVSWCVQNFKFVMVAVMRNRKQCICHFLCDPNNHSTINIRSCTRFLQLQKNNGCAVVQVQPATKVQNKPTNDTWKRIQFPKWYMYRCIWSSSLAQPHGCRNHVTFIPVGWHQKVNDLTPSSQVNPSKDPRVSVISLLRRWRMYRPWLVAGEIP